MIIGAKKMQKLIMLQLFMIPVIMLARSLFGLPSSVFHIYDIVLCLQAVCVLYFIKDAVRAVEFKWLIVYFVVYTAFLLLTQIFQSVPLLVSLMAYRRIYRFYLFFIICSVFLKLCDIDKIMQILLKLQIFNFALTMYQYFVQKLPQDNIGGIFGTIVGVNGYSNVYLCIICTYVLVKYFSKQETVKSVLWIYGSTLLITAITELKLMFIEVIAIVVMTAIFYRPKEWRQKVKVTAAILLLEAISLLIFNALYPEHMLILINKDAFLQYSTEVILGYNISRLKAFSEINELFFKGNLLNNMFGYGFGNCEVGSAFYEIYSEYHYTWFTHQVTFLETGFVGVVLYCLFYAMIFFYAWYLKKKDSENECYYVFTQIICALCALWFIYNQSTRTEPAYMIFFALTIPFIVFKEWRRNK